MKMDQPGFGEMPVGAASIAHQLTLSNYTYPKTAILRLRFHDRGGGKDEYPHLKRLSMRKAYRTSLAVMNSPLIF